MNKRLPKDWRYWKSKKGPGWVVIYTNPYARRREVSPVYATKEDAEECAELLRFQGAKRIRIERV